MLFQTSRKVTLPHLVVGLSFSFGSTGLFLVLRFQSLWISGPVSVAVGFVLAFAAFKLFCQVLPVLQTLVKAGVFLEPDQARLDAKIVSYLGRERRP